MHLGLTSYSEDSIQNDYDKQAMAYDSEPNILIELDRYVEEQRKFAIDSMVIPKTGILDLCCGSGRHLPFFEQYFQETVGVDYSN